MTREQTIEAIRVMQAFVDGKVVEFHDRDGWKRTDLPEWQFSATKYRIKSTETLRPWTADEVPLGAWIRCKKTPHDRHLLGWVSDQTDRELWLDDREHSTDGGVTWKPCGVVEDAK